LAATLAYGADHGTYKDCSRVDFCTNLRGREPSDNYAVDPSSISGGSDSDTLTATLKSNNGDSDLTLTLTGLQQNTFRLKITEVDSSRYELQDVLDGDPETQNFDNVEVGDASVTVTTSSGSNSAVINFSPFNVEFSKDGVSEVVFNGDRLAVTRNDVNAPFSFAVTYPQAVQLYGVHEHCDTLALRNTADSGTDPYRLKNSDVAYYEINSPMALYGAVPVIYGHGSTATAGVFLHNAAEQWIEISNQDGGSQAYFMAEIGTLDIFVLLGPTPTEVVRQYTALTGTAHLPQLWTLGYHQSRYSYDTQEEVQNVISGFDSNNFQLDAIWLDIDYTDSYKYFTWNPGTFSDPVGLQETIASTNKKLVTIIDPHIKVESGYNVYDGALNNNLFVMNADGSVFEGPCWPGTSSYMDFLNPEARDYYASMYSYDNFQGSTSTIAGIWNDMNEPSVFDNSLEMTLPADSLHNGNVRHREIHNIYGFFHTMATHQGLLNRDNGERRPFVLTRSHFAGSQRYAAIWTGDNTADWPYLLASFQECLNANILGIVFCGADVAGFFNNPTDELYQRWYQAGAWLPFFRAHSNKDTSRREPYIMSEDTQNIVRDAIQTRYRHIPQWYTLFYEHTRFGDPIIRPLFYQYPEDTNVYSIDNQILVGRDILVRPVTEPGVESVDIYFPGGEDEVWVSDSDVQTGSGSVSVPVTSQSIPYYYRRGGVIVRKDTVRSNTVEMADDPYTVYWTADQNNQAHGTVYLDDGVSFKYQDSTDYNYFNIDISGDDITVSPIDGDGNYEFVMTQLVRRDIVTLPKDGKRGTFKETIFTRDANGTLLKDIKIHPKEKTVFKLK
jgi:alpha 1,3-glucosidase